MYENWGLKLRLILSHLFFFVRINFDLHATDLRSIKLAFELVKVFKWVFIKEDALYLYDLTMKLR